MARPKKVTQEPDKFSAATDALIQVYDDCISTEYQRIVRVGNYFGLLTLGIQTPMEDKALHQHLIQQATFNINPEERIEFEHALIAHGWQILNR